MTGNPSNTWRPQFSAILGAIILCWMVAAFIHLYYFGYASMDAWCYSAPALTARAPLALTMPFLGTFERANQAWGLHWPGGPLLVSLVAPFLPRNPATFVSIYLSFWLLLGLASAALVWRFTRSPWLALFGLLFIAGDQGCFSVTWLERYEVLDAAIAIAALLALCPRDGRHPVLRAWVVGIAFFLFPLLQPVISALALAWLFCLGVRTWALRRPWGQFLIALAATALGWAAFLGYYLSRPWLLAIFINHAHSNMAVARRTSPPGVRMFVWRVLHITGPVHAVSAVYILGVATVGYLLCRFWSERRRWREFVAREDLALFAGVALVVDMFLAQFNYTNSYWIPGWPFAVALVCHATARLTQWAPGRRVLWWAALSTLLLLDASFLPARTWLWRREKFVNMRAQLRDFADSLPPAGQLFVPEALWQTFADGHRPIYMTAVPGDVGDIEQKKYADFIRPLIHSGDIFVTDELQAHATLIDPRLPGWREIAHCDETYSGTSGRHGYALVAYQKQ